MSIYVYPQRRGEDAMRSWIRQHSDFVLIEGTDFVSSYVICDHEVTQREYLKYMRPQYADYNRGKGDNYPIYYVTWYDAVQYCNNRSAAEGLTPCYLMTTHYPLIVRCDFKANGYRLPTEIEWTYAALGGSKSQGCYYSGSNRIDSVAWYGDAWGLSGNSDGNVHPVKSKKPNELKIYDMSGNVSEWCWNVGEEDSLDNPGKDYSGPDTGYGRIIRGGSAFDEPEGCAIITRAGVEPQNKLFFIGFRVVRSER